MTPTTRQLPVLDALGDPTRRAVLEKLRAGPKSVVEIAAGLPVSRPAVSQHLRVLKGAGLVIDRRAGNRRYYQIDPAGLAKLRDYVEGFWAVAMSEFQKAVEGKRKERKR